MKRLLIAVALLFCAGRASAQTQWVATSAPAVNVAATATKAAAVGIVHVAKCVSITLTSDATAPAAVQLTVVLRDGATGVGTVLNTWNMSIPAVAGTSAAPVDLCGFSLGGTKGNAMTLEYTAAGGGHTYETVTLLGEDRRQ